MEENNVEQQPIKTTMAWSEVLTLGLLASLVYFHAAHGNPMTWALLLLFLVIKAGVTLWGFGQFWASAMNYAQGILTGNPVINYIVQIINPLTWPALVQFIVYAGAAVYVLQVDMAVWPVALAAISPHVFRYFVYNRILRFVANPAVQEYVETEMKFFEEEDRRNAILQEELNKVMPEVEQRTKERWVAEGLFSEETNEHNQPVESDQDAESKTSSDD